MNSNIENTKKHFALLKEIFLEASRIRDKSFIHHDCYYSEDSPYCTAEDLQLTPSHLKLDAAYYLGFSYQEYVMDRVDWNIENLFRMFANVNVYAIDFDDHRPWEEFPKTLDNEQIEEFVQNGLKHIGEFGNNL